MFGGEGWAMARIGRQEHARILQMVDGEHRKVAEVAAEYGCTSANIYALLGKLRREVSGSVGTAGAIKKAAEKASPLSVEQRLCLDAAAPAPIAAGPDLFASGSGSGGVSALEPKGSRLHTPSTADTASTEEVAVPQNRRPPSLAAVPRQALPAITPSSAGSVVERLPAPGATRVAPAGVGAALSKPGMALVMRTADGEENMTPFRSLDDLLSAAKPILRAAARSPDAVWFSIQPVDLASLDTDAA